MTISEKAHLDIAVCRWTVLGINIRSPVLPNSSLVLRLELEHPKHGRITDVGKASGALDAAFIAAGRIVGIQPRLLSYNVRSAAPVPGEALPISVVIGIELNDIEVSGSSIGAELVRCSVEAWLDAVARSQRKLREG